MARYQIILAYDGAGFAGSQRQATYRTVQGELEKALRKIGWQGKTVLLAGRTDAGVHASGQVAVFDHTWEHGLDDLLSALNASLPQDMAAREVKTAPENFHPRFDAASRRYRYRLFCDPIRDPLRERYAWRICPPLADLSPLARLWIGRHDFTAFGSPPRPDGSTLRTVMSAEWRNQGDEWIFEIQADGFLYRMVRKLVFVQVAVGQGRLGEAEIIRALHSGTKTRPRGETRGIPAGIAPPNGLTLVEVCYENLV